MDIAEHDRLSRLALEREVEHIRRTQGDKAAVRARRWLSAAIEEQRRRLIEEKLRSTHDD